MQLLCPQCSRVIEYSGERPSFCGYCGNRLAQAGITAPPEAHEPGKKHSTADFLANTAATLPPSAIPAVPEDQAATDAPSGDDAEPLPQRVGGYRLLQRLGKGGMGSVYEAEDSHSGRRVAVKLIAAGFAASRDAVERFRQEGRLASTIAHPRCVFVLATDEDAGRPYIVMELMPGSTLRDLVAAEGPLPPARAVELILDVIDGLHEAHENGLIHRDVKPSNCFLQTDGRVKVGDFGLAKSLTTDAHLTKTGTFLGTPLFASPEQVRGDRLDPRTDVYSVAATLYYLLAGKAPFEGGDAASTLARIVADPAPSLRTLRPEISTGLDRVVLRGLERQRERRWQSMEEFRNALAPFVPGNLSKGGMGIRFGAFVLDYLVLMPLHWLMFVLVLWTGLVVIRFDGTQQQPNVWVRVLGSAPEVLYYSVLEGWLGWSVGKWLLNLRVCGIEGRDPPGLGRACLRVVVLYLFLGVPVHVAQEIMGPEAVVQNPLLTFVASLFFFVGVGLVLCTMRARNGYRGVHEFASGTRVVMLPWPKRRRRYRAAAERALLRPADMPSRIGPYAIQGALRWSDAGKILVGEDKALGRMVWLELRPIDAAPLAHARRDLARAARLRWLAGGAEATDATTRWDAFLAPRGGLLIDAVASTGPLTWTEARPLLEDLADELLAACHDGTLPERLSIDQVWMQPSGRVQLLDIAPVDLPEPAIVDALGPQPVGGHTAEPGSDEDRRSLALLAQVATMALERPSAPTTTSKRRLRAPMPLGAARFMNRLVGTPRPYEKLTQFRDGLHDSHDQPTEVTRLRRFAHTMVLGLLLFLGIGCCAVPVVMAPTVLHVQQLGQQLRAGERALASLNNNAPLELAAQLVQPDGWIRLRGAAQWQTDAELRARLRQRLDALRTERDAWKATLAWPGRQFIKAQEKFVLMIPTRPSAPAGLFRKEADSFITDLRGEMRAGAMVAVPLITIAMWPAAAVVWAFLWRGGLAYLVTGITVVRRDGRKAARWQCAWRALLFWIPLAALLAGSLFLDAWFWTHGDPHVRGWPAWLPLLSSLALYAVPLVLIVYLVLALWSPTRSWHDRLAGTLLMPR